MPQTGHNQHMERLGTPENRAMRNQPTAATMASEEDMVADVDEPPDLERTPRPSVLKLHESFVGSFSNHESFIGSFSKTRPALADRRESLLTSALRSNVTSPTTSPVEETANGNGLRRGMSCASTWSNTSTSTAELTSDGGLTSPGTRTRSPSPPLPSESFRMAPIFNNKSFEQTISIIRHDDEHVGPLQKVPTPTSTVQDGEAPPRKRCITFACGGRKEAPKPAEATKPQVPAVETTEVPKRTIKFACPAKVSTDVPSMGNKPRMPRAMSPAPKPRARRSSPKVSPKAHRDSNSTVRNPSPVSVRKQAPIKDRIRRLSANSDLARCEEFRFHEFASSEEEIDAWLQESTCHRSRLTITDTLKIENTLRQLGEEAEEEAMDDEEEDEDEDVEMDDDDDEVMDEDEESDEGFQTDDEEGFAGSDESDAGSDFAWWAPGARSTAATSIEPPEYIRPGSHRSTSGSSIGSLDSASAFKRSRSPKTRKSRPVNIRAPSPELPDSTDFVCGTLDEDRPLEAAYLSCLEARRAAKHKATPQDIDPTFPKSDPEMDEEDEDDDLEMLASDSEAHVLMHGQMDAHFHERGRHKNHAKRSPALSPTRARSPPPAVRRGVHRSPPPRKLFGNSPKRMRSPAPMRLRSPPPTRRGSEIAQSPRRPGQTIRFTGLGERPAVTSSSVPRRPMSSHITEDYSDEETCSEMPVRRAIDIKIGLEKKRQRRKEQQYKKLHRKGAKDKDKRPAPGKGYERMREMGLGLAAHKGKTTAGLGFGMPPTDQQDMHVLSV